MSEYSTLEQAAQAFEPIVFPVRSKSSENHYDDKEIHVSMLVKNSAYECARRILTMGEKIDANEDEDVSSYYGTRGEAAAFAMTPDAEWEEVTFRNSLDNGWSIVGTTDFVLLYGGNRLAMGECKFHNFPRVEKEGEMARRQAAINLAMWWDAYREGQREWRSSAHFQADRLALLDQIGRPGALLPSEIAMVLPDSIVPGGLLIRIMGSRPELCMAPAWHMGNSELDNILAYYREKAQIIADAVDNNDPNYAKTWDGMNVVEFSRTIDEVHEPVSDVKAKLVQYDEANHAISQANLIKVGDASGKAKAGMRGGLQAELMQALYEGTLKDGKNVIDDEKGYFCMVKPKKDPMHMPGIKFYGSPYDE